MKNKIKSYDNFNKFCTSLQVAKKFGREHRYVLTSIRKLICSDELCDNNFIASYYTAHNNKKQPMYFMTYKGFIRLIYTFRGEKAHSVREAIVKDINDFLNKNDFTSNTKEEA